MARAQVYGTSGRRNSSSRARRGLIVAAVFALWTASAAARAQTAGTSAAESLFEQGRAQMAGGDYVGACPKFEESYRLDRANGTLLALALCHEAQGRWASALNEFMAVQAASAHDGRADRVAVARTNIASLEPKVSKLAITAAAESRAMPSFDFECDGAHLDLAAGDLEVVVDPGTHLLQASASGHVAWAMTVQIGARSERVGVHVPPLEPLPPSVKLEGPAPTALTGPVAPPAGLPAASTAPPAPPVPPTSGNVIPRAPARADSVVSSPSPWSARRVAGIVVAGVGVVATGVGVWEGLRAIADNNDARSGCSSSPCANVTALAHSQSALNAATVSDVLLGAGALSVAVGAYLWFGGAGSKASVAIGPRGAQLHLEW
jgi:hypothetical protein